MFEAECCDHCNGGRVVAVNRGHLEEARTALAVDPASCEGQTCTLRACEVQVSVCDEGRCSLGSPGGGCGDLDEDECAANPNCSAINGAPAAEICAENWDRWNQVYAGCMEAEGSCGAAETCGIHPRTGERYLFPSTCLPSGWVVCNTQPCDVARSCEDSAPTEAAMLCVQGEGGGPILAGERLEFVVYPDGCFSSSCTRRTDIFCAAQLDGSEIRVEANFCLGGVDGDQACTDDCGGGGEATCYSPVVAAGPYTVYLGDNGVDFNVPSNEPPGVLCVGSRF